MEQMNENLRKIAAKSLEAMVNQGSVARKMAAESLDVSDEEVIEAQRAGLVDQVVGALEGAGVAREVKDDSVDLFPEGQEVARKAHEVAAKVDPRNVRPTQTLELQTGKMGVLKALEAEGYTPAEILRASRQAKEILTSAQAAPYKMSGKNARRFLGVKRK